MSFKPWKQPLLVAIAMIAGTTAATAQNVQTAQRAIELGRFNEARAMLRPGSSPEAAFELGRLYQMRDMPDSAAFYFNRASGTSPFGKVAAGRALLAKGEVGPAEAQFDAAAKATKNKDAKVLTMIAQAYGESDVKDISKAQNYLNTAQTVLKKDDPALMVARGDVFLHSDQGGGEAMTSYDRAIATNPSYAQAYYKKGALSVRSRNFNAARESLNKAVELDPSYAPAYRELADMYYYAGQYDLALSSFQKYIGLAEKSPATDAQYASFLYLTKKYPEALAEVNKVLQSDPKNLTMNRLKPYLLYETGDFAGAATAMDAYLKVAPADKLIAEDYAYQAKIMSKTGHGPEAVTLIKQIIAKDPSKGCDLQNDLAAIYANQKDYKGAVSVYKYKLTSCKGDLTDQFRLATALTGDKQYTRADSVYNIILTAKPTYAPGYLARAKVNSYIDPEAKQGLAKPYYEKYIELSKAEGADPAKFKEGVVEANGYLGVYNFQKGDKAAALSYFEQVLAMDPENKGAANNISILKAKPRATTTAKKTTTKTTVKKK
ncbi:tetratricopeptide repeat protein [Hymenobacter sp. BT770]|uniref:tetratricopeptide repeat protein n=1 Tax=Hymenobacter sp. BT770 TaxID=2886942 RepID=UPI001D0F8F6C|nr:tetratricopeptide repeat protein [Hymenobacter sp. BT770]MCC3155005.1 tetratricopeptide repeat protein [Hymenobacter sp. BT770]MDO3416977.1 tetratricopeptide repeat protein [Hymenobacter sp. BT770]